MADGVDRKVNVYCAIMAVARSTTARSLSRLDVLSALPSRCETLDVAESSCVVSMVAKLSQTAVVWRCAAAQTSSSTGPGGSERRVLSDGSEVMALIRSLTA